MSRTRNLLDYQEHSKLQGLVHELIDNSFMDINPKDGSPVTSIVFYADDTKAVKLRETTITRSRWRS